MTTAIVGISCLSPLGLTPQEHIRALAATADPAPRENALLRFKLQDYISTTKTYLDRGSQLVLAAGTQAFQAAGFQQVPRDELGVVVGSTSAGLGSSVGYWEKLAAGPTHQVSPLLFAHSFISTPACLLAIEYKLNNVNATIAAGVHSGLAAILLAEQAISAGQARGVLAGSIETYLPSPQATGETDREGAAAYMDACTMLALEAQANASARGQTPLAMLRTGWFHPRDPEGAPDALRDLLRETAAPLDATGGAAVELWTNTQPGSRDLAAIASTWPRLTIHQADCSGDMLAALAAFHLSQQATSAALAIVLSIDIHMIYGVIVERWFYQ